MVKTREVVGVILVIAGLALILAGLVLATRTPHSLDDFVIVAKGWVDGVIMVAAGTTVFLGGVAILKGAE